MTKDANIFKIEVIRPLNEQAVIEYDRAHDKRKLYSCNRCTAIWKCEWQDNEFGSIQEYNGDPDILCPFCGSNDTKKED